MFQVKALILQYLFYCVESHTIILVFVHKAVELGWGWGRQLYVGNTRIFLVCLFFFLKQHWCPLFLSSEAVHLMIHSANDNSITERRILHSA